MTSETFKNTEKNTYLYRIRRKIQLVFADLVGNNIMSRIYYFITFKKISNFKNPQTFNEKLQIYKLVYCVKNDLVIKCSDKYLVRDYVIQCGFSNIMNELLGVYNNSEEINWDSLPNEFALKCNHGCGYNLIVFDKDHCDKNIIFPFLNKWIKEDFGKFNIEPHYDYISKKIVCEKFIGKKGGFPLDYKIYYFDGKPTTILVCSEREKDLKLDFYDLKWETLNYSKFPSEKIIKKPKLLDKAIEIGKILAKPFPFVRIDYYDCENEIIFGEMTFTPAAAIGNYYTDIAERELGKQFINYNL